MSFRAKRSVSEESRVHQAGVFEILRFALDDKMIVNFTFIIHSTNKP